MTPSVNFSVAVERWLLRKLPQKGTAVPGVFEVSRLVVGVFVKPGKNGGLLRLRSNSLVAFNHLAQYRQVIEIAATTFITAVLQPKGDNLPCQGILIVSGKF